MRIIELKELNSEDQRKVFTKLVCVYFENKSSGQNGNNNEFPEKMTSLCLTNGVNSNSNLLHSDYCYNEKEANLKGSFSASNLNSSIYSIHPGIGGNGLLKCFSHQNLFSKKSIALHFTAIYIVYKTVVSVSDNIYFHVRWIICFVFITLKHSCTAIELWGNIRGTLELL